MNLFFAACPIFLFCTLCSGQDKSTTRSAPVTVPATIDHNRLVIEVEVPLPDGSRQRTHAWVDNGDPDLAMSRHLATVLGLAVSCGESECSSPAPREIYVGGMALSFAEIKQARIPLKPVSAASVMAAGVNAEINIPATLLRHYDVLTDFPGHKFSIGAPGSIHFQGSSGKVLVNAENGLIQVPSRIADKKYNLALDVGASISFLSDDLYDKLGSSHPDWPHMTGAVGSANMWGSDDETSWKIMRLDRVQFGPLFLTDAAMVRFPDDKEEFFNKRAGVPTAGLLGANALQNYRVGLDYSHSMVYFDIGRLFNFPDFDVIGLVLRPEDDGRFTILGVVDLDGKPSVPQGTNGVQAGDHLVAVDDIPVRGVTMGQVWKMLGGTPGLGRRLTIERSGKQFTVPASVQHFLAEAADVKKR
jgi:Aspartyl protease